MDPIRAELNRDPAPWRAIRGTVHATPEFITHLDFDEVCDSLLGQLECGKNVCDPVAEEYVVNQEVTAIAEKLLCKIILTYYMPLWSHFLPQTEFLSVF